MATIGERIAKVRAALSLTQAALAKKIMVSRSYISEVEAGKGKPSIDMVVGIATWCPAVEIEWLLTGNGEMLRSAPDERSYIKDVDMISKAELANESERDRAISDIKWPLTSDQELLLENYEFAPQFFGQAVETFCRTSFDEMIENHPIRIPYAFSRQWVRASFGVDIGNLFLFLVRNSSMEPIIDNGSYALITHEDNYNNGKFTKDGVYLMWHYVEGNSQFFLGYVRADQQGMIEIAYTRPDLEQSFQKVSPIDEPILYVGRVVWVGKQM